MGHAVRPLSLGCSGSCNWIMFTHVVWVVTAGNPPLQCRCVELGASRQGPGSPWGLGSNRGQKTCIPRQGWCSAPPPKMTPQGTPGACQGPGHPQGFFLSEKEVCGAGSFSPGGCLQESASQGCPKAPAGAGSEKKGLGVPWASEVGNAKAAEGALGAERLC